jgi:hypothetical protein
VGGEGREGWLGQSSQRKVAQRGLCIWGPSIGGGELEMIEDIRVRLRDFGLAKDTH